MTDYFYTDFLAAAWMASKFQIKFVFGGADLAYRNRKFWVSRQGELDKKYSGTRFQVHPQCVHLFAPQDKDEGIDASGWQVIYFDNRWLKAGNGQEILPAKAPVKIDKRNGIAFMWPDVIK